MSSVQYDILKKLISKEIHKRKHSNKFKDETINSTNTLNILEDDEQYTSLSNTKEKKKKKKKKEKTELKKLSSNELINNKQKNTCNDFDTAYTEITYDSKIYKCEVCEKLCKSSSSLNKHKAKTHILNGDAVITTYMSKNLGDGENILISNAKDKKKKKKKKNSEEKIEIMNLSSNKMEKNEKQKNTYNDFDTAFTEITYDSKIYKCEVCEKLCKSSSSLNKHKAKVHVLNEDATYISKHLGDEENKCETLILNKQVKKMKKNTYKERNEVTNLSSNEATNNKQQIKCEVCEKSCKSDSALNKHKVKVHKFNKDEHFTANISTCVEDTEYKSLLNTPEKKIKKRKKASKEKIQEGNEETNHNGKSICDDIDTKVINNNRIFKCKHCEKTCKSKSSLDKHKAKVHLIKKDADFATNNISKCSVDEVYSSLLNTPEKKSKKRKKTSKEKIQVDNEVTNHKRKRICDDFDTKMINDNRIYKCKHCEKSCKSISSLDKHKAKAHLLHKDADFATNNISKCSVDEVYSSLLNTPEKGKKLYY